MMQELVSPIFPDDLPEEAIETIVWYLFAETLRDAVKIGQKKASHFRNNVGGDFIRTDRKVRVRAKSWWNDERAEKALQENTQRLDEYLDSSLFCNILLSLGRDVTTSVRYLREIMQGEHLAAATKGLNQIKKRRQMKAKEKNNV